MRYNVPVSLDYNSRLKSKARYLRQNQTEAEIFLWKRLRLRQVNGYKFRRQFPIQGFILDFYCYEKKLAIELDGSQHREVKNAEYDTQRTKELNNLGIKVIRFWDNDVFNNTDGVLQEILFHLTPTLS